MGEGDTTLNESVIIMEEDVVPVIDVESSSSSSPDKLPPPPKVAKDPVDPKDLRGLPKSGRFWKQPKQR